MNCPNRPRPAPARPDFLLAALALALLVAPARSPAQSITTPPQSQAVAAGGTANLSVTATGTSPTYQWTFNGATLPGATAASLAVANFQPANAGIYAVTVTSGATSATASAIVGLATTAKVAGTATEVGSNITLATNGNTYDQVLLQGAAAAITADPGQITRISYIDLSNDIVQVEFSGAGTLTLTLDNATGPAAPASYNQTVQYMKGHGRIVITGANETTNVAVFSVGTMTAINQGLFKAGTTYDGHADLASISVVSPSGKFGGVRTANASYFASGGLTGLYAPGVQFLGPVFVGDVSAFDAATPVLALGSAADTRITGGDLLQANGQPVQVSGLSQLVFADGTTSHGTLASAQVIQGTLVQNGVNVTSQLAASGPKSLYVAATKAVTDEAGSTSGEFYISRTGSTAGDLLVQYGVSGSATNGIDYPALVGFVTIPAGASSAKIGVQPYPDTAVESTETVTLELAPVAGYALGAGTATVSIGNSPGTLYVATLRPATGATTSAASGLATIVLSASGTMATVNVSFSNLSSGQAGAHLFLGSGTSEGDYVLNLPLGQVSGAQWVIAPTGTYTAAAILSALQNGLIYVGLDSAQFPAGELKGAFLSAAGSQNFTTPAPPPAVPLDGISAVDASRLLTQATFGPRQAEIDELTGGSITAWIDAQMALPASNHRQQTLAELAFNPVANATNPNQPYPQHRMAAWFYHALQGPDQLRQRVAFALSQIFVVSDATLAGQQYAEGMANYYDLLSAGAFGNFRTLLEQVTLSPIMGNYLSSLRNAKADPVAGTNPDENFAREVMQLFTIGLVQLQPDGTLKLDSQGLPLPTYNQATVTQMAKVFTGWAYYSTQTNPNFRRSTPNYLMPMMLYPAFHEDAQKTIVNGVVIPVAQGGAKDLQITLDTLFNHPNCGPFISRQLIQRLVTDNPSPAYVYRVAQKFADNGAGVRGDLGAVVRAILTDYEARSPAVADDPGYGKLREPLLRFTNLLRSFNAAATNGHYIQFANPNTNLAQAPLRAPSVFNFFEPGYVYPGPLAAAGLVAPEFQITDDTTAISVPNYLRQTIFATATGTNAAAVAALNLTTEQSLVTNLPALLDRLNLLLCGGQMKAETRNRVTTALGALLATTSALERAQSAVLLVATSPDGSTQN